MRTSALVGIIVLVDLFCAHGQDQERKLIDRLLKPDLTLQNDAQNKRFISDGSSRINKHAAVGTFYIQQKARSKNFSGTRDFSTTHFDSHTYHGGGRDYEVSLKQALTKSRFSYANRKACGVRDAPQSGKKVASRAYSDNRPFLDEGKSQESLNRHNASLTIDQVRELLNKNK